MRTRDTMRSTPNNRVGPPKATKGRNKEGLQPMKEEMPIQAILVTDERSLST